ncbi:MAG: hypothetical protein IPK83_18195 [Planctomycetes bacterium]|nr:hypothetical protein [Planctomycetota bacterium]
MLDGQSICVLSSGSRVLVSKSLHPARLVRNPKRRPLDTLISKLKWGVDVT